MSSWYSVLRSWYVIVGVGNTPSYYISLNEGFGAIHNCRCTHCSKGWGLHPEIFQPFVQCSGYVLNPTHCPTSDKSCRENVNLWQGLLYVAVVYLWHRMVGNSPRKAQSVANWSAILPFMSLFPITPGEKRIRKDSGKLRVKTFDSFGRNPMYDSLRDFISGSEEVTVWDVWVCECVIVWISYSERVPYNSWTETVEV